MTGDATTGGDATGGGGRPTWMARIRALLRREDGSASMEFVLTIPLLMSVFMAGLEGGMLMTRSLLMERAVDITMRNLRLGQYPTPSADLLKREICARTLVFHDCEQNIMLEMQRVSTATWALPSSAITCVNREEAVQPVLTLQIGQRNDVMLMRVCIIQDLIFPTTGMALDLPKDRRGGVGLIAETAFVVEPI